MKLIIAGGRNYVFNREDTARLDAITDITEVVSGGSGWKDRITGDLYGADLHGERYANRKGIPVKSFPADWKKYGKVAGPKRNKEMADYADAVVLFPGGRGTASMYSMAKITGLKIYDYRKD